MTDVAAKASWNNFEALDIRIGTIISAQVFEEAHKPAYLLQIDFGTLGMRKSSAQITERYSCADLIGKQIAAIVNFPPKQIANHLSECLILGALEKEGVVVIVPDGKTENGSKIG